jgi:hypothetical protein
VLGLVIFVTLFWLTRRRPAAGMAHEMHAEHP